jgi:hypothetical protein
MKRAAEKEVQATAQLIFKWLQTSMQMRDSIACMMLAQTALVWTQRPKDEDTVRKMMAEYTEGVVALWKAQTEAASMQQQTKG